MIEEKARRLTRKNFKFLKNNNRYLYTGTNNTAIIKLGLKRYYGELFCDGQSMMKDGICLHLVAFSWLYDINCYRNYSNKPKNFAISNKRGRHKKKFLKNSFSYAIFKIA